MGDPRRLKKKFKKPKHPYQKDRIMEELEYIGKYGLRNKREFWIHRTQLTHWRQIARNSRALPEEQQKTTQQELIKKLNRLGVLGSEAEFEDVLLLTPEDLLKRRLQSLVYEKGMARTIYEARQMIVHKHIQVGNRRVNSPSYIVKLEEEDLITYAPTSSFAGKKLVEEPIASGES